MGFQQPRYEKPRGKKGVDGSTIIIDRESNVYDVRFNALHKPQQDESRRSRGQIPICLTALGV